MKPFSELYPHITSLVESGAQLEINGGGYHLQFASLYDEGEMICQFPCQGMTPDAILDQMEEYAERFEEDGVSTDDIN